MKILHFVKSKFPVLYDEILKDVNTIYDHIILFVELDMLTWLACQIIKFDKESILLWRYQQQGNIILLSRLWKNELWYKKLKNENAIM